MSFIFCRNFCHLRNCLVIGANIRHLSCYSNSTRCLVSPLQTCSEVTRRHINTNFPLREPKISHRYSDPIPLYEELKEEVTIDQPVAILVLDLGTTGLSRTMHEITEIAVRDLNGGKNSMLHTLVNPEVPLTNHKQNQILTEPTVPRMKEVIPLLVEWVKSRQRDGKPVVLVAHNGHRFDFPFLVTAFHRCSYQVPEDWLFLDSLPLARQLCHPDGTKLKWGNHKLKDLVKFSNAIVEPSEHKTILDVNSLCSVLKIINLPDTDLTKGAFTASQYHHK